MKSLPNQLETLQVSKFTAGKKICCFQKFRRPHRIMPDFFLSEIMQIRWVIMEGVGGGLWVK